MTRVAVVHDWLTTNAGAERVLKQILLAYPESDIFCICDFLPENERSFLGGRIPKTTFIQRLPAARRFYRSYLPLMPLAIEQLDLTGYDLVISSSHAMAKGVITGPEQCHVSYIHTPIRYAWDLQHQYLRESGLDKKPWGLIARYLLHRIRIWDVSTANGVDAFLANSNFIAKRIWKTYRRKADVVYPPVDLDTFTLRLEKDNYFITVSRLVPYKRVDLIVEAFTKMPEKRLKVIGDGPERTKIESIAIGHPNIELMGHLSTDALAEHVGKAQAFIFAAKEDFGISPVEAQACGTPVIAYGQGGTLETVRPLGKPEPTGVHFENQTVADVIKAIEEFELNRDSIHPEACRLNAEGFSATRFRENFTALVESALTSFR